MATPIWQLLWLCWQHSSKLRCVCRSVGIYENWLLWAFTYYIEKYSSLRLLIAPYIIWMFNKIIDINIDNRNKIAVDKNYIDEATSSRYNTKVNLIDD